MDILMSLAIAIAYVIVGTLGFKNTLIVLFSFATVVLGFWAIIWLLLVH